jgi:uncharacterized membrane protein
MANNEPKHFSREDILYSFFGALFLGFTFMSKLLFLDLVNSMTTNHAIVIFVVTLVLITFEIYYLGYKRVPANEKKYRTIGEFWAKRFVTVTIVSLITSTFLVYIYGVNILLGSTENTIKAIIAIFMPCCLGATFSDLFRKIKF